MLLKGTLSAAARSLAIRSRSRLARQRVQCRGVLQAGHMRQFPGSRKGSLAAHVPVPKPSRVVTARGPARLPGLRGCRKRGTGPLLAWGSCTGSAPAWRLYGRAEPVPLSCKPDTVKLPVTVPHGYIRFGRTAFRTALSARSCPLRPRAAFPHAAFGSYLGVRHLAADRSPSSRPGPKPLRNRAAAHPAPRSPGIRSSSTESGAFRPRRQVPSEMDGPSRGESRHTIFEARAGVVVNNASGSKSRSRPGHRRGGLPWPSRV